MRCEFVGLEFPVGSGVHQLRLTARWHLKSCLMFSMGDHYGVDGCDPESGREQQDRGTARHGCGAAWLAGYGEIGASKLASEARRWEHRRGDDICENIQGDRGR